MWRAILSLMVLLVFAPVAVAQDSLAQQFTVTLRGIKIGVATLNGSLSQGRYSGASQFASTGLIGQLGKVAFVMKATGNRSGAQFLPLLYSEEVQTGRRNSTAELRYSGGVPSLTGGKLGADNAPTLDPATQGGTLDPLTPLLMIARPQPPEEICRLDRHVFDGARRTRLVLAPGPDSADGPTCTGRLDRLAGYSPEQMAERRSFDFTVQYGPASNGMVQVDRITANSLFGPVTLTRR